MNERRNVKQPFIRSFKYCLCLVFLSACSISWHKGPDVDNKALSKKLKLFREQMADIEQKGQGFIGFALYDPELKRVVLDYNADKYFAITSGSKLISLLVGQQTFGDSIPAFNYVIKGDSLLFWNIADPAFTYKDITATSCFNFLKNRTESLYYINSPYANSTVTIDWGLDDHILGELERELKKPIKKTTRLIPNDFKVIYGLPADSVYKRMFMTDDSGLAEHLLILSSSLLSDTISSEKAVNHLLESYLNDIPDNVIRVGGANAFNKTMFTPRTVIYLLQKLLAEYFDGQLFHLLADTELSNTFKSMINSPNTINIYCDSGSLSNVCNQSGYFITKNGKVLLYCFVNNNFKASSSEIRTEMVRIMTEVHEKY